MIIHGLHIPDGGLAWNLPPNITVRENLDLLGRFSDEAIWNALAQAHADEIVRTRFGNLDGVVSSRGDQVGIANDRYFLNSACRVTAI